MCTSLEGAGVATSSENVRGEGRMIGFGTSRPFQSTQSNTVPEYLRLRDATLHLSFWTHSGIEETKLRWIEISASFCRVFVCPLDDSIVSFFVHLCSLSRTSSELSFFISIAGYAQFNGEKRMGESSQSHWEDHERGCGDRPLIIEALATYHRQNQAVT